jgi:hypothetical protein
MGEDLPSGDNLFDDLLRDPAEPDRGAIGPLLAHARGRVGNDHRCHRLGRTLGIAPQERAGFLGVLRFLADLPLLDDNLVGGDEESRLVDLRQEGIGFGMGERQGQHAWVFGANDPRIDVRWHHRKRVPHRGQELPPPL